MGGNDDRQMGQHHSEHDPRGGSSPEMGEGGRMNREEMKAEVLATMKKSFACWETVDNPTEEFLLGAAEGLRDELMVKIDEYAGRKEY